MPLSVERDHPPSGSGVGAPPVRSTSVFAPFVLSQEYTAPVSVNE